MSEQTATRDGVVSIPPKRPRGRPKKDGSWPTKRKEEGVVDMDNKGKSSRANADLDMSIEGVRKGVTATWLARVLDMDVNTVTARLKNVTPMTHHYRQAVYDLRTAIQHLVDPVADVEDYIRNMDPKLLPPQLTTEFWRAEKLRLQTLEHAQNLWSTEKVTTIIAVLFKTIRDDTNLWIDTLDEIREMSDDQRRVLNDLVHGLLDNIHSSVKEYAAANATRSELEFLESRLEMVRATQGVSGDDEDEDSSYADLL